MSKQRDPVAGLPARRGRRALRIVALGLVAALVATGVWFVVGRRREAGRSVRYTSLEQRRIRQTFTVRAEIDASERQDVMSTGVEVAHVYVSNDQYVSKGDLLLRLDREALQRTYDEAKALREESEATLERMNRELEGATKLELPELDALTGGFDSDLARMSGIFDGLQEQLVPLTQLSQQMPDMSGLAGLGQLAGLADNFAGLNQLAGLADSFSGLNQLAGLADSFASLQGLMDQLGQLGQGGGLIPGLGQLGELGSSVAAMQASFTETMAQLRRLLTLFETGFGTVLDDYNALKAQLQEQAQALETRWREQIEALNDWLETLRESGATIDREALERWAEELARLSEQLRPTTTTSTAPPTDTTGSTSPTTSNEDVTTPTTASNETTPTTASTETTQTTASTQSTPTTTPAQTTTAAETTPTSSVTAAPSTPAATEVPPETSPEPETSAGGGERMSLPAGLEGLMGEGSGLDLEAYLSQLQGQMGQANQLLAGTRMTEEQAKKLLDETPEFIYADFDGVVTGLAVEAGDSPAPGRVMLTVFSRERLVARFSASRHDLARLRLGQPVQYRYDVLNFRGEVQHIAQVAARALQGTESLINTAIGSGEPTVPVTLSIDGEPAELTALIIGFDIDAQIQTAEREDSPSLPLDAVLYRDEQPYVWVIDAEDRLRVREIEMGLTDDFYTEVLSGLTSGERVVVNPAAGLVAGDVVSPRALAHD